MKQTLAQRLHTSSNKKLNTKLSGDSVTSIGVD